MYRHDVVLLYEATQQVGGWVSTASVLCCKWVMGDHGSTQWRVGRVCSPARLYTWYMVPERGVGVPAWESMPQLAMQVSCTMWYHTLVMATGHGTSQIACIISQEFDMVLPKNDPDMTRMQRQAADAAGVLSPKEAGVVSSAWPSNRVWAGILLLPVLWNHAVEPTGSSLYWQQSVQTSTTSIYLLSGYEHHRSRRYWQGLSMLFETCLTSHLLACTGDRKAPHVATWHHQQRPAAAGQGLHRGAWRVCRHKAHCQQT